MNRTRHGASGPTIAGRHHPLMKQIRAMLRSGVLQDGGEILLETPLLIEDAMQCGASIHTVLIRRDAAPAARRTLQRLPPEARRYEVQPELFAALTSTERSPGILALADAPTWKEADLFAGEDSLLIILAGIQDPGNLGAILRAGEAFGATGVLATKGTVSPFNAKAVRAAAGTLFRLPILTELTVARTLSLLQREKVTLLASAPRGGASLAEIEVNRPVALALGSEGAGLPREFEEAGQRVSIPIASGVESLNVASAASVMLYEIARCRSLARAGRVT